MFARLFPTNPTRIYQEVYDGAVSTLYTMPITLAFHVVPKVIYELLLPVLDKETAEQIIKKYETEKELYKAENATNIKLYAFFVAPVIEEFIFRGVMTPVIQGVLTSVNLNPALAPFITNILFTHLHNVNLPSIYYLSSTLETLTSIHEGSLWSGITAHALYNIINRAIFSPTVLGLDKEIEHIKLNNNALKLEHIETLLDQGKKLRVEFHRSLESIAKEAESINSQVAEQQALRN